MASEFKNLEDLKTTQNLYSVKTNFPKLWITKTSDGLFVNNAEIITFRSNYPGRTSYSPDGKEQVSSIHNNTSNSLFIQNSNPDYVYSNIVIAFVTVIISFLYILNIAHNT